MSNVMQMGANVNVLVGSSFCKLFPLCHDRAFQVRKYGDNNEKSYWTEIGIAWVHDDGQGFNVKLNSLPLDGNITIRPKAEKKAASDESPAEDEIPH